MDARQTVCLSNQCGLRVGVPELEVKSSSVAVLLRPPVDLTTNRLVSCARSVGPRGRDLSNYAPRSPRAPF